MPTAVTANPAPAAALARLEKLAHWLDDAIPIPGTRFKLGLESLIGLIPGAGDVAGLLLGGWVIVEAHRAGAPAALKWTMARNTAADALIGLVPVLGDVFDFAYRSNRRNLHLLLNHLRPAPAPVAAPRPRWALGLVAAGISAGLLWWLWLR